MKRIVTILVFIPLFVQAQLVQPVKWSGEEVGDSVRLRAVVEPGWHMSILEMGEFMFTQEFKDSFSMTVAKTDLAPIRFNACNDVMCTAPEIWEYESVSPKDDLSAERSVSAVLYGLSIVILYVGLGLLVTILFGASALNDLSTNAVVNIVFFLILVIFALSFFGLFEITLPDSWSTALDSKARSTGGFLSILLMAFTLVIVSFSCTGPIIGTLLVEAAGKSLMAPAMGMLGFAIALALPFSLFAMFPEWLKQAPKSGDWMTSFKVVLAFLELALSLKFLSVADMAYGWGILPRWLFIAIWIACFAGIGIYLLWNIRNVSTTRKIIRAIVIIPSLVFAGYLVPGLWGAPVKAISAFAPPMEIEGREVFNDYEEGLAYARQTGKPVIIDFTGYGCVNCRKMEAYVLDNDSVKSRLQNYVFIELFVDDKRDGIGDRNSAIQREQFGSNAQPYYVQLDAYGTQVADPMAFTTDPMEFINWLKY